MKKGVNTEVLTQLANSPDTNLLDLESVNDKVVAGEGEMIEHIQKHLQIIQGN